MTKRKHLVRAVPFTNSLEEIANQLEDTKNKLHDDGYIVGHEQVEGRGILIHAELPNNISPISVVGAPEGFRELIEQAARAAGGEGAVVNGIAGAAVMKFKELHDQLRDKLSDREKATKAVKEILEGIPTNQIAKLIDQCGTDLKAHTCNNDVCPIKLVLAEMLNVLREKSRLTVS